MTETAPKSPPSKLVLALVLLLGLHYLLGTWRAFHRPPPNVERLRSNIVFSQRLGLAGEFCVQMPGFLRRGLSSLARYTETDPLRLQLLNGNRPENLKLDSLPHGYGRLLLYREKPSEELERELTVLAYQGLFHLNLCFLGLCVVLTGATFLCFWGGLGKPESREGDPPSTWPVLLLFTAWVFWNRTGMSYVLRSLKSQLSGLGLTILLQALSLLGLALLSYFILGRQRPQWPSSEGWRWVGLGYVLALTSIHSLEWCLEALTGSELLVSVSTWLYFLGSDTYQRLFLGFVAVALAPLMEEYVFRYCLLEGLSSSLGDWKACFVVSLLFAIGHGELLAIPGLTVLGMILGGVYLKTRSLWPSALLHALWNATTLCFLFASLP